MNQSSDLERFYQERAAAIIRADDQETARNAIQAAVRGGFRVVEFTLGCPGAYELIEEFAADASLTVGVGTVLKPEQARDAVSAGARFVVSPVTDESVIETAVELGVIAMPGTHTATEMERAHRAGAHLQKLFPAPANGPQYVSMMLGPLPFLRIVPTSGVTAENAAEWFAAGVFAVGFVGSLFEPKFLRQRDFDSIEARARACVAAVRAARRPEPQPPVPVGQV